MQEHFKPLRLWDTQTNQHRNYQIVECSRCPANERIAISTRSALPPEVIVKRMQDKGWGMGHRRKNDLCPDCMARSKKPTLLRIADYVKTPWEPTVENKKKLLCELERRYDVSNGRYQPGWSDEKVAEELGAPVMVVRSAVADFRELMILQKDLASLRDRILGAKARHV